MKKKILKHILALALGGAFSALAGAQIDPEHMGKSLGDLAKQAGTGAAIAVVGLNARAPKDEY